LLFQIQLVPLRNGEVDSLTRTFWKDPESGATKGGQKKSKKDMIVAEVGGDDPTINPDPTRRPNMQVFYNSNNSRASLMN
jgi:hypothetical protein